MGAPTLAVTGDEDALAEMAALTRTVTALAVQAGQAGRWSGDARRVVLEGLDRAVDALATARAAVLVAERECGTWQGSGDPSFEAWRARSSRSGQRSAVTQVRQAEQLAAVPSTVAAVSAGEISLEHAAVIAKVASTGTPAQRDAARSADGQEHLLGLAARLDAGTFAVSVAQWAATIDPAALERDHQAQRAERYLNMSTTPGGTFVKGRLDNIAGHRVLLALEALSPRPAADDDRDHGQRHADALDAMAGRILAAADTKPGGHVPPQITMILNAETWAAAQAGRDRRRAARTGPGVSGTGTGTGTGTTDQRSLGRAATAAVAPGTGYPPATLEDGTPVPATELAAAMCDCEVTRLVLDADSAPLDLGRAARVFTGPQRRAVIARDRECAWPQCHAHARWCQIHHIRWWERDDGPTSVDNGVLLCSYHHHEVHRRDLTITRAGPPPTGGAPPGSGGSTESGGEQAASAIALFRYVFRDRNGHAVGDPGAPRDNADTDRSRDATHPRGHPATLVSDSTTLVSDSTRLGRDAPTRPPARLTAVPTTVVPTQTRPGEQADHSATEELDLTRVTDPVTGANVPQFLLVE